MNFDELHKISKLAGLLLSESGSIDDASVEDPLTFAALLVTYDLQRQVLSKIDELVTSMTEMNGDLRLTGILEQLRVLITLAVPESPAIAPASVPSQKPPVSRRAPRALKSAERTAAPTEAL